MYITYTLNCIYCEKENQGREFLTCPKTANVCKYFYWSDGKQSSKSSGGSESSIVDASDLIWLRPDDYVIYTDGACSGNKNVAENDCPAGFGAVVGEYFREIIS